MRQFMKIAAIAAALLFGGATSALAQLGTVPNTFVAGTVISSADVNLNFSTAYANALNRTGGTMTGDLLFTDATYDIGKSGATRPRDIFTSRNVSVGGTLAITGNVVSDLLFTDATYDIGKSGATRPRDLFISRNGTVGGTLGVTGATTLGTLTLGGNVLSDVLFTDATYDIGKSGATRPRDGFFSRNFAIGGTLGATGAATLSSTLAVTSTSTLTGSVGIGTAPGNKLDVLGSSDVVRFRTSTRNLYFGSDANGMGMFSGAAQTGQSVYLDAANDNVFLQTGATTRQQIDTNGNISIGGIVPTVRFDVRGASGDVARISTTTRNLYTNFDSGGPSFFTGAAQTGTGLYLSAASNYVGAFTSATERMRVQAGVTVGDTTDPGATNFRVAGTSTLVGAVSGGLYNGQTISSAASLTGTLAVAGTSTFTGVVSTPNLIGLTTITPSISADQDNYAPTGYASASFIHITVSGTRTLTGLQGGVEGRILFLRITYASGAGGQLNISDENTNSSAANRFILGSAAALQYAGPIRGVTLLYTGSRWVIVGIC